MKPSNNLKEIFLNWLVNNVTMDDVVDFFHFVSLHVHSFINFFSMHVHLFVLLLGKDCMLM
ncbi:hypothetical protein Geu3261_0163_006 [Komagataeibacter europaeus NBRC 3261]|uniref:Uncharacterized protein n=1 Tax=Komagataeibacter europaeus NBRC 3261 TaxID=1234669 RepID=A0A0D6Q1N3_KOMEU|nr:hypothetical protein Geu3261_0163_006 [Komagataeibacter europaeus NBRC 3261]